MTEGAILTLDAKIQKLINNYTELKNKYAELVVQKSNLEQGLQQLRNSTVSSEEYRRLEEKRAEQAAALEKLHQENSALRERVALYETKMHEATAKIDGIFEHLSEL
ncbi:MAG: hypothetical protein J7K89_08970 [Candidatus Cloacimonetes bacterium]|nr:hypothetical protein [Candidatus Cloacimonadota bacterium]